MALLSTNSQAFYKLQFMNLPHLFGKIKRTGFIDLHLTTKLLKGMIQKDVKISQEN